MTFRIFIFLLLLPLTCFAAGEDHLVPENSVYADQSLIDYDILVSRVLGSKIPSTNLKLIAIPSFRNEYAISVDQETNACKVSYLETKYHLWIYELSKEYKGIEKDSNMEEMLSEMPANPYDVPVVTHNASLENEECNRITSVWNKTLLNTRYPAITDKVVLMVDGTIYHFSTWIRGYGTISGKTYSPDSSKIPGRLVGLANAIGSYAKENTPTNKIKLANAIKDLENVYK
jgi:hypothetical protein